LRMSDCINQTPVRKNEKTGCPVFKKLVTMAVKC
jgi:hypothetical protein